MTRAYVGLGSNIDAERNTLAAVALLARRTRVVAASTFYRTEAIPPSAPPFINGVIALECTVGPRALKLDILRRVEAQLGRAREADRNAPRTIDCDLLLYGDSVVNEPDLVLPHPDIVARAFVAVPLAEIAPNLVLPGSGARVSNIAAAQRRGAMNPLVELTRAIREEVNHESGPHREARS